MPEAVLDAVPIVIGGVGLAFLGGLVWGVRQIHGLLYKATNGDDDSLMTILTNIATAITAHHTWAVSWAEEAENRRREDGP